MIIKHAMSRDHLFERKKEKKIMQSTGEELNNETNAANEPEIGCP